MVWARNYPPIEQASSFLKRILENKYMVVAQELAGSHFGYEFHVRDHEYEVVITKSYDATKSKKAKVNVNVDWVSKFFIPRRNAVLGNVIQHNRRHLPNAVSFVRYDGTAKVCLDTKFLKKLNIISIVYQILPGKLRNLLGNNFEEKMMKKILDASCKDLPVRLQAEWSPYSGQTFPSARGSSDIKRYSLVGGFHCEHSLGWKKMCWSRYFTWNWN
jgi:hypothetical protein